MVRKIILDTNFLLIPYQFKVDIFSEIDRIILEKYQLYILDKTLDELEKIVKDKEQKGKNKLAAKLALLLVKAKDVKIIKTKKDKLVDDLIVELADKDTIVCTQDTELKKRLPCKIITLRQKKKLILV